MLEVTPIQREFCYNGTVLPDPNPNLSIAQVQQVHAVAFPELANAKPRTETVSAPNGLTRQVTTFSVAVGTKG